MISEWMKVMLEEISRKKEEAEQARAEEEARAKEQARIEEQTRNAEQVRQVVIKSAACAGEQ
jgi:DNA-binding protein H-NS